MRSMMERTGIDFTIIIYYFQLALANSIHMAGV